MHSCIVCSLCNFTELRTVFCLQTMTNPYAFYKINIIYWLCSASCVYYMYTLVTIWISISYCTLTSWIRVSNFIRARHIILLSTSHSQNIYYIDSLPARNILQYRYTAYWRKRYKKIVILSSYCKKPNPTPNLTRQTVKISKPNPTTS